MTDTNSAQQEAPSREEGQAWEPSFGTPRKVIQLATMPGFEREVCPALYALCDDGTIWAIDHEGKKWQRVSTKSITSPIASPSPGAVENLSPLSSVSPE